MDGADAYRQVLPYQDPHRELLTGGHGGVRRAKSHLILAEKSQVSETKMRGARPTCCRLPRLMSTTNPFLQNNFLEADTPYIHIIGGSRSLYRFCFGET